MEMFSIMHCSSRKLNTTAAIHSFYVLLELENLANVKGIKPNPFSSTLRVYSANLAKTFFDYCAMICLGEARHGKHTGNIAIRQFLKCGSSTDSREYVYSMCDMIDPVASATALKEVFLDSRMSNTSYGGVSWSELVDTYVKYGKVSDIMFIDMVINKQHNNGTIFSKPCLCRNVDTGMLRDFLDFRRDNSPLKYEGLELFNVAIDALQKAKDDYGLIDSMPNHYFIAGPHKFPQKIEWGFITIEATDNPHRPVCPYCGEDEDDCCCDICTECGEKVDCCTCSEGDDCDSDYSGDSEDITESEDKNGIYSAYISAVGALDVSGIHAGRY